MSQATDLYKKYWNETDKTDNDRQTLRRLCVAQADKIDVNGNEGFKFDDGSKLIFTPDNVQVSLF